MKRRIKREEGTQADVGNMTQTTLVDTPKYITTTFTHVSTHVDHLAEEQHHNVIEPYNTPHIQAVYIRLMTLNGCYIVVTAIYSPKARN